MSNNWFKYGIRPIILAALVGIIAWAFVGVVRLFEPTWSGVYFVVVLMVVTVETQLSHHLLRRYPLRGEERMRFGLTELVLFFFMLRLSSHVGRGWVEEAQLWLVEPSRFFLDAEVGLGFLLLLVVWGISSQAAQDFDVLDGADEELPTKQSLKEMWDDQWQDEGTSYARVWAMARLRRNFWRGGGLLLVMVGVVQVGWQDLLSFERPPVTALLVNVLAYFLMGLVMLGLLRYASLRRRWHLEQVRIADNLLQRWLPYLLFLVGVATVAAFILPVGDSSQLLSGVSALFLWLTQAIVFLAITLLILVAYPFIWLYWYISSLFGNSEASAPDISLPTPPPALPTPVENSLPEWYTLIQSLLFGALLLGMVHFTLRTYFYDRPELLAVLRSWRPFASVDRLSRALWGRLQAWWTAFFSLIPRRLPTPTLSTPSRPRWMRMPGGHSPREQVLHAYYLLLRQAREEGIPRQPAHTPKEYEQHLAPRLVESQADLMTLTQYFMKARYSQAEISVAEVDESRVMQEKVRNELEM